MGGNFFKVDRAIFDHSIWQDPVQFRIFFYLMGKAVFAKEGLMKGSVHVKRGHYLISFRRLRDELEYIENNAVKKYPISRIHRAVEKLESSGMICKHETELGTLFEVVNYEKYQASGELDNGARNATRNEDRTENERNRNNNKKEKKEKNSSIQQLSAGPDNPFNTYHMAFGVLNAFVTEDINFYLDKGMDEKIISYAIEKAAKNGSKFKYAIGILDNWLRANILTYEAAIAEEEEFNKRKVERIHGAEKRKRPETNRPSPNVKGSDRSRYDFSKSRNSL